MVKQKSTFRISKWYGFVAVTVGMGSFYVTAFHRDLVPYSSLGPVGRGLHYLAYQQHSLLVLGFAVAWGVHLAEAIYGFILGRRKGISSRDQVLWFIQNFALGFPSLGLMRAILRKHQ